MSFTCPAAGTHTHTHTQRSVFSVKWEKCVCCSCGWSALMERSWWETNVWWILTFICCSAVIKRRLIRVHSRPGSLSLSPDRVQSESYIHVKTSNPRWSQRLSPPPRVISFCAKILFSSFRVSCKRGTILKKSQTATCALTFPAVLSHWDAINFSSSTVCVSARRHTPLQCGAERRTSLSKV